MLVPRLVAVFLGGGAGAAGRVPPPLSSLCVAGGLVEGVAVVAVLVLVV